MTTIAYDTRLFISSTARSALRDALATSKPAAKPAVKTAPVPALTRPVLFNLICTGGEFDEIRRIKAGAAKQKKARKIHRSKVAGWLASLERNGYEVQYLNLPGDYSTYAMATQRMPS